MFHRVDPGRFASAMGEDFPAPSRAAGRGARIDAGDDALAAEFLRDVTHQFGPRHRCRVDRDLVGTGQQQRARILHRAYPATDGQRHETDFRGTPHHIEQRPAPFVAGRDVEEAQLVGTCAVISLRLLDRITRILEIDEIDPLHHATVAYVEAGNDANADGHGWSLIAAPPLPAPPQDRAVHRKGPAP